MKTLDLKSDPYWEGYKLSLEMSTSYDSKDSPYPTGSPESIEFWRGYRDACHYANCRDCET